MGTPHFVGEPVSWLSKVASILSRHRCCHAVFWRVHRASLGIPFLGFPKSNRSCQDVASAGPFSGPALQHYLYRYRYYCCRTNPLLVLKLHRSCEDIAPVRLFSGWVQRSRGIRCGQPRHACCLYTSCAVEGAQKQHTSNLHAVLGSVQYVDCRALATAFGMGSGERELTYHQPSHACGFGCNHTPACRARPALARTSQH